MERSALLIALCALLLPGAAVAQNADGWNLVREGTHVRVYSREVPGSRFLESKALTTVEARLTALVALVIDVEKHPQWIDSIDESRLIESVGPALSFSWSLSKAPWPVSDRDAIASAPLPVQEALVRLGGAAKQVSQERCKQRKH